MSEDLNIKEDLSIKEKGSVGQRVAANTGLMVAAKALAAVFGLVSLSILMRTLSMTEASMILFIHVYMLFFTEVVTFQSWQAVIRFGTPDLENKDTPALARLLRFCVALDFFGAVVAFILAITGLFFMGQLLPMIPSMSENPELLANVDTLVRYGMPYCLLVLTHQEGVATGLFRLFDSFKPLAFKAIVMTLVRLLAVLVVVVNGWGFLGFLGAWFIGSLVRHMTLPILALIELRRRKLLRIVFDRLPTLKIKRKGIWPFVLKSNLDSSLALGSTHLPVMLVAPIFGIAYVGIYKAADEMAKLLSEGVLLLDRVIYPEYSRMMARGQSKNIWKIVIKTGAILVTGGLALSAIVMIFGQQIVHATIGDDYIDAVPLSVLLVLGAALMGAAAPLYPIFFAAGHPERAIMARGAGLSFYIFLVFFLSKHVGMTGPGWAMIGGNLLAVILTVFLAKRTLDKNIQKEIGGDFD